MSVRTELVGVLEGALGPKGYRVIGYPGTPDTLYTTPTVCLYQSRLDPSPAGRTRVLFEVTLWLITPKQSPGDADDALDLMLTDVVDALNLPTWTIAWSAAREVLDETYHGWHLTLTADGTITHTED